MALFTVQPATFGSFEGAGLTALAKALERDHQTVRRVKITVRGVVVNLMALATQPAPSVGAIRNGVPDATCTAPPGAPRSTSSRLPDLGVACSNAGDAGPASSRWRAGPE